MEGRDSRGRPRRRPGRRRRERAEAAVAVGEAADVGDERRRRARAGATRRRSRPLGRARPTAAPSAMPASPGGVAGRARREDAIRRRGTRLGDGAAAGMAAAAGVVQARPGGRRDAGGDLGGPTGCSRVLRERAAGVERQASRRPGRRRGLRRAGRLAAAPPGRRQRAAPGVGCLEAAPRRAPTAGRAARGRGHHGGAEGDVVDARSYRAAAAPRPRPRRARRSAGPPCSRSRCAQPGEDPGDVDVHAAGAVQVPHSVQRQRSSRVEDRLDLAGEHETDICRGPRYELPAVGAAEVHWPHW